MCYQLTPEGRELAIAFKKIWGAELEHMKARAENMTKDNVPQVQTMGADAYVS
ncbi:MAG: hypothetical protein SA339_08395 [Methanomassiliicoccus sp.]|nr:hypothetical protein [Methanomassiliicoccus sp.]